MSNQTIAGFHLFVLTMLFIAIRQQIKQKEWSWFIITSTFFILNVIGFVTCLIPSKGE